jgi:serine/threonine protein kinase
LKLTSALLLLACLSAPLSAEPLPVPGHKRPLQLALLMLPVLGLAALRLRSSTPEREDEIVPGYTLQGELGRGGTAVVYSARHNPTGQAYAIKLLKAEPAMDQDAAARMRREIKLMRDLQHPGIVSLCDFGEFRGQLYMVLEKINGCTLRDHLQRARPSLAEALHHSQSLLEAMAYAHGRSVIHRDLKPENLMVNENGQLRLLDFGFSRSAQRNTFETMDNSVAGTPAYMAPERLMCQTTPASDQYSLGLIAYEMLTGRPAIPPLDVTAVITKQLQETPPSPRSLDGSVPEPIDRFVMKLIAKKPEDRFESMQVALQNFLEALQLSHQPSGA